MRACCITGPGSLPPGLISRRRGFDDGASDISSVASSNMDYSGEFFRKVNFLEGYEIDFRSDGGSLLVLLFLWYRPSPL